MLRSKKARGITGEFVKIDLHVHTPASTGCYKGKKDDEEYLSILKQAKKKKLRIIAITDHNSIKGYKKLVDLRNTLGEKKNALSKIKDSTEALVKLRSIDRKLSLFEGLLILPGIEFEVSNGIHLLVIFDETVQIDRIETFLRDGGYDEETFGREEPTSLSTWDIFRLYEESIKYDCIVIDAHTDASKGIWDTIRKGMPRANCFSNPQLCAVGFKNEVQKENISRLLETSHEYKRANPLAFVRFSDAHNYMQVGSQVTWVKLNKIDFASLKIAFANPEEMVSTELPSVDKILNSLIKKETSFGVPYLSDDNIEQCKKLICALNNSTGGHLLLGVTSKMTKVGMSDSHLVKHESVSVKTVKQIQGIFIAIEGMPLRRNLKFNKYPLQNNRMILSVHISCGNYLATIKGDGCIYTLRNREIRTLTGPEIQAFIEEKTERATEERVGKRISEVEKHCLLIKNFFASRPIIRKFENASILIRLKLDIVKSIRLSEVKIEKLRKSFCNSNGKSKGNVFFLAQERPPRLKYAYLRYSVPLFNVRHLGIKTKECETIYLVPGGGAFYSKRDYPFFGELNKPILKLTAKKESQYGLKFILAYLKSSFLLWYLSNKLDDINLYSPKVYQNIRIPKMNGDAGEISKIVSEIEGLVDKILEREREFLVEVQKVKASSLIKVIDKHNSKIDDHAYDIDQAIFRMIGLSDGEIDTIEHHLRLSDIYLPERLVNNLCT